METSADKPGRKFRVALFEPRFTFIDLVIASGVVLFICLVGGVYVLAHHVDLTSVHEWAYTDGRWWQQTTWMGVKIEKNPLDLWTYSNLLYDTKPDVLIECGTFKGGSALYYAELFDLLHRGRVITIDIEPQPDLPQHPRIMYLTGSSTSPEIISQVKAGIHPGDRVMVVLDSDHSKGNVLKELNAYTPLVTPGMYMVVEDTDINGHPVHGDFGPGPYEAVGEFLSVNHDFEPDKSREKYGISFFPHGWLRRIR